MKDVIFTVDVEGHVGDDPITNLIYGIIDGHPCGIDLIMDICDKHNVKGLFFVDIAEAFDYGEEKISDIIKHIVNRGHDVGVHIHPDHMADPKRLFLFEYSESEQYQIINKCTDFYKKVLGVCPKAFRAGKYGANRITLDIIAKLGYVADFSEFYGQKWCGIDPPVSGTKSVVLDNGLIEFPTMSYRNSFPGLFDRYDKIDAGMPFSEYKIIMRLLKKDDYTNPIVLFAHSFSLIDWRREPNNPKLNIREVKKLNEMINYVCTNNDLIFTTLNDLIDKKYERMTEIVINRMNILESAFFMIPRAVKVIRMHRDIKLRK